MNDDILTEDIIVEGYVCTDIEGPLKPSAVEQGIHVAGFILCSDETRKTCAWVTRGNCRLLQVKMHYKKIPFGKTIGVGNRNV